MIANFIASWIFITVYVGALIIATAVMIFRAERSLRVEKKEADKLIRVLISGNSPEGNLLILNRITDARIISHDHCRSAGMTFEDRQAASQSIVLSAAGIFLGCITSTMPLKHHVDGLRPAAGFLLTEIKTFGTKSQPCKIRALGVSKDSCINRAIFAMIVHGNLRICAG
jgi:hypothetical protein